MKKTGIFLVTAAMLLDTVAPAMAAFEWTNELTTEFTVYEDFSGSGTIRNKTDWQKIGPRGPSYNNGILSFGAAAGDETKNTTATRTFDQISSEKTRFAVVDLDFKLTTKAEGMIFNVSGSTLGNYITVINTTLTNGKLELWTDAGTSNQAGNHFTLIDDVETNRWYSISLVYDLENMKTDYYIDNIIALNDKNYYKNRESEALGYLTLGNIMNSEATFDIRSIKIGALTDKLAMHYDSYYTAPTANDWNNLTSLTLPTTTKYGSTVAWTSSDTNIIANDGTIDTSNALPSGSEVTLTAVYSKDGSAYTRSYTGNVYGMDEPESFAVESIVFSDEIGNEIDKPLWDTTSYVDVTFIKPRDHEESVDVLCAIYDKNGRFVELFKEKYSLSKETIKEKRRLPIDGTKFISGGELKVFVWRIETATPLCDVRSVELGTKYNAFTTNTYFSNNAVLQRDKNVLVCGNGPEDGAVTVTLGGVTKSTTVENDVWKVYFDPHEADGQQYTLSVTADGYKKTFTNIVFGDVYLLSGQSNMAYAMSKFTDTSLYSEEIAQQAAEDLKDAGNYPNLRTYKMKTVGDLFSDVPVEEPQRNWNVSAEIHMSAFSAVGYYFGTDLSANTDVPIGLILTAISGSYLQMWLDDETIEKENIDTKGKDSYYNAVIHPFTKFPIKGVLWYQGESNYNDAENYARYMKVLINSWREKFNDPELPFLYVQLPSYGVWDYRGIRDAQMEVYQSVDNVGMVVQTDEGEENEIHPWNKPTVGKRLSLLARGMFYGYDKEYRSPVVKRVEYNDDSARVIFDYAAEGLKTPDSMTVNGFEACGEDGIYVEAEAVISGKDAVTVTAEGIDEIKGIRYSYQMMMTGNLYNSENLPAAPYRSK
ncbi:MAG: hypothetical protein IJH37_03415 [Clostridia bacterium]|nr:hypothetical protein [Clostridia bacterium]